MSAIIADLTLILLLAVFCISYAEILVLFEIHDYNPIVRIFRKHTISAGYNARNVTVYRPNTMNV